MTRPEELLQILSAPAGIHDLLGQTEDLHLECKVWPAKDDEAQKMIAKAVCGFANADGGVIVIGLKAKAAPDKDQPDTIQSVEPVADTSKVKSKIQDLIGQLVEPGVGGILALEVNDPSDSESGFVVVLVPASDGLPCRSRKDWKFYQRISSGTYPMEYFQIADMFGRRQRPILDLHIEEKIIEEPSLFRRFDLGIKNSGRAIAKYPGLRFRQPRDGTTIAGYRSNFGLKLRFTDDPDWIVCGGGVDDVIYPGATIKILTLTQPSQEETFPMPRHVLPKWSISVELSAEDIETKTIEKTFPEKYKY